MYSRMQESEPYRRPTRIAVIVPVLNEGAEFTSNLECLACRLRPEEIIVVDGGNDSTVAVTVSEMLSRMNREVEASPALSLIRSMQGRARQMNTGAAAARADILLFLHADTQLPDAALDLVRNAIGQGKLWGRFNVQLSGSHFMFRIIETMMNWRSRLSRIATGDQAMFVRWDVFKMLGGYADIELMEDIELCRRLNWIGPPACLSECVVTSSRRWKRRGIVRTVLLMWLLRFLYWLGVPPKRFARWYK